MVAIHAIESGFCGVGDEGWGVVAAVVGQRRQFFLPLIRIDGPVGMVVPRDSQESLPHVDDGLFGGVGRGFIDDCPG